MHTKSIIDIIQLETFPHDTKTYTTFIETYSSVPLVIYDSTLSSGLALVDNISVSKSNILKAKQVLDKLQEGAKTFTTDDTKISHWALPITKLFDDFFIEVKGFFHRFSVRVYNVKDVQLFLTDLKVLSFFIEQKVKSKQMSDTVELPDWNYKQLSLGGYLDYIVMSEV